MNWLEYDDVESDPEKMGGTLVIKGTRVPVSTVVDHYDTYRDEGLTEEEAALVTYSLFPSVSTDRIHALVAFCNLHELELTR